MKCMHEGCLKEATYRIEICKIGEPVLRNAGKLPSFCDEHTAKLLRSKADEVEGVEDCPNCDGRGYRIDGDRLVHCFICGGDKKVPR